MTKTKRWLDELPLESSERELLLVGKSARPDPGDIDANWQALCVALGTAAAVTGVATSSVAANAVSAKVSTALVASNAANAGLVVAGAKSLALGVAVGLAVMGAGAVAEHVSERVNRSAVVAQHAEMPSARRLPAPRSTPSAAQSSEVVAVPAIPMTDTLPHTRLPRERSVASGPFPNQGNAPPSTAAADNSASLSQQARELAELKRLIDSGATREALRRLETNFSAGAVSVLSEERDALYVQALAQAHRREEARSFAAQFLIRYPHSPYSETMRRLLTEK